MKKVCTLFVAVLSLCFFFSCNKKTNDATANAESKVTDEAGKDSAKEKEKPIELPPPTAKDIGEAYGVLLASAIQRSELEMDIQAMRKGYNKAIKTEITKEAEQEASATIDRAMKEAFKKKQERNRKEGEEFLEKNKKRTGVVTLESGLQYEVLTEGTGAAPTENSTCKIHYVGRLVNGKEFENSKNYQNGEPVELTISSVIPGWKEGLTKMKTGGRYMLYIPYKLAYGEEGIRSPYTGEEIIPPCAALIFDIELVETSDAPKTEDTTKAN